MDYRESHKGARKAASYHSAFEENPYRSLMWELEKGVLESILDVHRHGAAGRHLDFACGTGRVLGHLAPRAETSTGVDVSAHMLSIAKATCSGARLVEADLTVEPATLSETFDVITAFRFFPNAQNELRTAAMSALQRRLGSRGLLIFNNHKNASSVVYRVARVVRGRSEGVNHEYMLTLIEQAGLELIETRHLGVFPSTEQHRLLPRSILAMVERRLMTIASARTIASNIIYVCRRRER